MSLPTVCYVLLHILSCSCADNGCNQKFSTKSNLKKHIERKHENPQKQYVVSMAFCFYIHYQSEFYLAGYIRQALAVLIVQVVTLQTHLGHIHVTCW